MSKPYSYVDDDDGDGGNSRSVIPMCTTQQKNIKNSTKTNEKKSDKEKQWVDKRVDNKLHLLT